MNAMALARAHVTTIMVSRGRMFVGAIGECHAVRGIVHGAIGGSWRSTLETQRLASPRWVTRGVRRLRAPVLRQAYALARHPRPPLEPFATATPQSTETPAAQTVQLSLTAFLRGDFSRPEAYTETLKGDTARDL